MAQPANLKPKIEALNKVFQFYYKENHKTLRKAYDFYIPFIIGRKKRLQEFQNQYIPFSVALFLEGVRNSTAKMDGEPNAALIEALRKKLLNKIFDRDFEQYWNVIESELERNPTDPKAVSTAVASLLMYKLYGPESSEPRPDRIDSQRHIIAAEFQVGKIHYQYSRGSRIALERLTNPKFDAINVPEAHPEGKKDDEVKENVSDTAKVDQKTEKN